MLNLRFRPGHERFHTRRLSNVKKMEMRLPCPRRFRCRGNSFQSFNASGAEQQIGALRAEGRGRRGAETAGSAGDQNPFVFERR